jgi:23S rRNA pseudouridine2605 synthase
MVQASTVGMTERLHKVIANSGLTSRRKAEQLIEDGRVSVDGEIVTQLGTKVEPHQDVRVDGEPIRQARRILVVAMNKPRGVVTTMSDPGKRTTVMDLAPDLGVTLKPVGRLDKDTEGLLLLTNDGSLAAKLTHARHGVEKEYVATVRGLPDDKVLGRLSRGIPLEGKKTAPAVFQRLSVDEKKGTARLKIVLHEGRKRQIREMLALVGYPVVNLKRVRVGNIVVKGLAPGQCRTLSQIEIEGLRRLVMT